MKFSIAVPVRGQEEFIATALQSLQAQSVSLEVAVLDATPDDSIQRVLKNYRDLPLVYSRHGLDKGQAAAIQEGWDRTGGDILSWLNADDYLFPGSLAAVEKVFAANPDVDVVYGDAVFVDQGGGFTKYFPAISGEIEDILKSCCISQPACWVRRAAIENVGGLNTDLNYIMDWDLWTRLFIAGAKFLYVQQPLAVIRMHEQTKTASGSSIRLREIQRHLRHHGKLSILFPVTMAFMADTTRSNSPIWKKTLRAARQLYRCIRLGLLRWVRPNDGEKLYGIDIIGNRVRSLAEVWLPWFDEREATQIIVEGEECQRLQIEVNGVKANKVEIRDRTSGKKEVVAQIPNKANDESLFIIKLTDESNRPWNLISVRIN